MEKSVEHTHTLKEQSELFPKTRYKKTPTPPPPPPCKALQPKLMYQEKKTVKLCKRNCGLQAFKNPRAPNLCTTDKQRARRLGRGENGPVVVRRSEEMETGEWV